MIIFSIVLLTTANTNLSYHNYLQKYNTFIFAIFDKIDAPTLNITLKS